MGTKLTLISIQKVNTVGFNYKVQIKDSNDIVGLRNKIKEYARTLGFQKTQLTVLATAVSEAYRLFVHTFGNVTTTIHSIEEIGSTGIAINISGILQDSPENGSISDTELEQELKQKLEKVKNSFSSFELNTRTNTIILTLTKTLPVARETKYPKNN